MRWPWQRQPAPPPQPPNIGRHERLPDDYRAEPGTLAPTSWQMNDLLNRLRAKAKSG